MKKTILATIGFALLLLASCENASNEKIADTNGLERSIDKKETNQTSATANEYAADTAASPPGDGQQQSPQKEKEQKEPQQRKPVEDNDWDKKIIKTASVNLEVKDYNSYSKAFREKIRNLGGYIAQENQEQSEYKIQNTIVIKVPAAQFDEAITLLTAGAEKVNEKNITSQDVTAEYVDTRSRMEAKKQVRDRYMDLLKQAKNMEEILNVQSEINGVQEEIEAATGRINYLGHAAVFSTISLTYFQVLNEQAKQDETPSLGSRAGNAFRTGWTLITDLLVGLLSIWPLLLAGAAIVYFVKRKIPAKTKEN